MGNRHVYWLATVLTVLGLGLFLYKALALGFPVLPGEKSDLWDVEARVKFSARGRPVKVSLFIPRSSRRLAVVDENFISRGFGLTTTIVDANRQAVWAVRRASGPQALYYRSVVQALEPGDQEPSAPRPKIDTARPLQGSHLAAAESLLGEVREQSADLDTLVAQLVKRLADPKPDSNVALLLGHHPDPVKVCEAAVRVLALAETPARVLRGVRLTLYSGEASLVPWLQVYTEDRWKAYDPADGTPGLPDDFLIFTRGNLPLLQAKGADRPHVTITVRRTETEGLEAATTRGRAIHPGLLQFSLQSLPIQAQTVYQILLVIPLGAFLLIIMRNVVGVKTFGTFMPVLMGLAFRETQLFWGMVLFTLLVSLGLSVRFYLERLKLLLVPRLAAVLTIVVLLMAALSILSHRLGLEHGLSVALFPMVIMTMTIERMSILWEERGPGEALQQGLGSLGVAALAYVLMTAPSMQHLMFVFPELLLVVLAGSLLLGRYTGYRLVELGRFKSLTRP
ncbi:MAG: inactive transglutaminase family protein [Gammaproteobacteria bacterium]